ncbi:hypothetical protein TorRG33x02_358160, partial [Trema orientale]
LENCAKKPTKLELKSPKSKPKSCLPASDSTPTTSRQPVPSSVAKSRQS